MRESFDRILKGLLPGGEAVLLAVSGGVDSMCMADLFLGSASGLRFALAHCNFHLRGEESDSDEALVKEWAGGHGIIFIKKDFDTLGYAASKGISVEMAARELRYGWFAEICRERGFAAVAVAHNANDNAETMILNMLRGTGVKGMTGMRRSAPLPGSDARIIRPLLGFPRKDILEYAVSRGLRWREDSTNADSAYKRNRVRNEVFPIFERLNPSFLATLGEDMERFAQVQSIADEYFSSVSAETVRLGYGGLTVVDHRKLTAKKNWEYVLFRILEPFGFGSPAVADLVSVLKGGGTVSGRTFVAKEYLAVTSAREIWVKRLCGSGDGHFDRLSDRSAPVAGPVVRHSSPTVVRHGSPTVVRQGSPTVVRQGSPTVVRQGSPTVVRHSSPTVVRQGSPTVVRQGSPTIGAAEITIEGPGTYSLDGIKFSVSLSDDVKNVRTTVGETRFDTAKIPFPFKVRHWRNGDWMRPLGMKGRKKLSDLFVDLKFGLPEKEKALVIADEGSHIQALIGCRIDDSVKVTEESTSVTVLRLI